VSVVVFTEPSLYIELIQCYSILRPKTLNWLLGLFIPRARVWASANAVNWEGLWETLCVVGPGEEAGRRLLDRRRGFHLAIISEANHLPTGELHHGNPTQIQAAARFQIRREVCLQNRMIVDLGDDSPLSLSK
jgi:hypothetical protein